VSHYDKNLCRLLIGRLHIAKSFYHVIKKPELIKSNKNKSEKMDDENDFEDFEDDSVDPFASSESEIDDSDVENDLPAERIVEFYSL